MLLSYCCHWKATPSEPSLHCFLSISMTGKILFPPKPTERFPLIFMQLGFCPIFVALKIKCPSVCEQLERTRAWNCACPTWWMDKSVKLCLSYVMDGWLTQDTPDVSAGRCCGSSRGYALGIYLRLQWQFTLQFLWSGAANSTVLRVPEPEFSPTLGGYSSKSPRPLLHSLPTSCLGDFSCKINCVRPLSMLTCKSIAQQGALSMTGAGVEQVPASKYKVVLWENCCSSLSSELHLKFLISWEIKD